MNKILFLQYPKCSTCRKAGAWLKANNTNVIVRDITTDAPTKEELKAWIDQSGLPIQKFFNTSGKIYKEQNLKDKVKTASKDELIDLLASNGMVVKRPLLVSDRFVLVGFNEEEWLSHLK